MNYEKQKQKGFAPIAIILIIIAVLAVGGIAYYVGKSSTPAPQSTTENDVTNTPLTITYPTQGATLTQGQTYTITWTGGDKNSSQHLQIMIGGHQSGSATEEWISTSTGKYSWTVSTALTGAPGSGFFVTLEDSVTKKIVKSGTFSIVGQTTDYQEAKVLDLTGLDGCSFVIELKNGQKLEPINLTNEFKKDKLPVLVKYTEKTDMSSICMVGKMVELTSILKIN